MTTIDPIELLLTQAAWARRLARSLVRDEHDADDALQDTWLSALRDPPATDRPVRGWLATVLRRHVAHRRTAERRRDAREAAAAGRDEGASPEALLAQVQVQRVLAEVVTGLAEPYRQTILMRYYEGRSSAEIARATGVPAGTVRWRLKTGIDQIRAALDERHGGERARWLRLVAPLAAPPVRPTRRGLTIVAGAAAVSVCVGAALLAGRPGMARRPAPREGGNTPADPSRGGASAAAPTRAASRGSPGTCADVERLRKETAATEAEALDTLRADKAFARGQPNPGAEAALGPIIARIMKADAAGAPAYTFECRTWACRMTVLQTEAEATRERTSAWVLPIQLEPEMGRRTKRAAFLGGGHVRDPLSGALFTRRVVYVKLADPSGGPPPPTPPAIAFGPLPATAEACREEVAALRQRIEAAKADIDADLEPQVRFRRSPIDAALTDEIDAVVRRVVAGQPDAATYSAECRGFICKIASPIGVGQHVRDAIRRDPQLAARVWSDGTMGRTGAFIMLKSPAQRATESWLRTLLADLERSPAVATCRSNHPTPGDLRVELRQPERPGDALVVECDGTLVDTPFARCVAEALARATADARPPEGAVAAEWSIELQVTASDQR